MRLKAFLTYNRLVTSLRALIFNKKFGSLLQCSPALCNLPSQGTTLSAVTANGLPIQVSCTIEAQVKVASKLITHKFYIANDITGDGILGMDFLGSLGVNVDLGKSCLRLRNSELPLRHSANAKQIAVAKTVREHSYSR